MNLSVTSAPASPHEGEGSLANDDIVEKISRAMN